MSDNSSIEWTDATLNTVYGCRKISAGCANCYAVEQTARLSRAMPPSDTPERPGVRELALRVLNNDRSNWSGQLQLLPERWYEPLLWRVPRRIFVNSLSDIFHEDVPLEFLQAGWSCMERAFWHEFQVLTKRSGRLRDLSASLRWPVNVWMGVSVENADAVERIDHLRRCGALTKFLSCEPLLGPLPDIDLAGIDWVIVGGESGPGARPMRVEWVRAIRDACVKQRVAFFFKQWGRPENNPNRDDPTMVEAKGGRTLDGRTWDEFPRTPELRISANALRALESAIIGGAA